MGHKIDTQEDYLSEQRIADARKFAEKNNTTIELPDDSARAIMERATRRIALSPGQYTRIMMVARAIANLDHSINLRGKHVAEAVQYRADRTVYSLDRIVEKLGVK
jgi:predicted ATPase with chaperone activity